MKKPAGKRRRGITGRWITGNLLFTFVILLIAVAVMMITTHRSYYSSVAQTLEYRARLALSSALRDNQSMTSIERYNALVSAVENFGDRDRFELLLIDNEGKTIITSSGFTDDLASNISEDSFSEDTDGFSSVNTELSNGEHVAVATLEIGQRAENVQAIRLVTSLESIDAFLVSVDRIAIAVGAVMFLLSFLTGLYFVRSIVIPIREVKTSAKLISEGNYDVRITNYKNDEVGELCDSINEMASGLNKTERMKNDFISSVSHELRTPLTSIKGWSETLLSTDPTQVSTYNKGLSAISSECSRLYDMVEELLDFSKVESGRAEFHFANTDIIAELTDAVISMEQLAANSGITINYNEPEIAAIVYADPSRIKQIFVNLIDNAIKYSGNAKTIDIGVSLEYPEVTVSVTDHGVGIPKDQLPLITQKFYKGNTAVRGSGIGLALVKDIVERHGGTLTFNSEFGQGTTAAVTFKMIEI